MDAEPITFAPKPSRVVDGQGSDCVSRKPAIESLCATSSDIACRNAAMCDCATTS
jgi:hypothetical protein